MAAAPVQKDGPFFRIFSLSRRRWTLAFPALPVLAGGALIVIGGAIVSFWKA
jgi:hypothetical protein